jgi:transcriptional regulator GlxA family with amidase domain
MDAPVPTRYAIVLFEGFQALDAFGPLDILNLLSRDAALNLSLHVLAPQKGPVSTLAPGSGLTIGQDIMATHSFADMPSDIEVILVPGGVGTRNTEATQPVVNMLRAVFPKLRFLLTICTGSALAARAGLLAGRRATSNKRAFNWVKTQDANNDVHWVPHARWVEDGNVWTASGVSAGIDMMYAFVAAQYGEHVAANIARTAEYTRNRDPDIDAFAI